MVNATAFPPPSNSATERGAAVEKTGMAATVTKAETHRLTEAARSAAVALDGGADGYATLLKRIGAAQFVLIGEASHGTHEFYRVRADITRQLIERLGFCAVAAEAGWPDAYRVNRYLRGEGNDRDAEESLRSFE